MVPGMSGIEFDGVFGEGWHPRRGRIGWSDSDSQEFRSLGRAIDVNRSKKKKKFTYLKPPSPLQPLDRSSSLFQ